MTLPIFDEEEVLNFIRMHLSPNTPVSEEDILDVVDAVWDFYDDHGYTSLDDIDDNIDDEEASDEEIADTLFRKFETRMDRHTLLTIIKAERDYEEDLDRSF